MKKLLIATSVLALFFILNAFDYSQKAEIPFPQEYNAWQLIKANVKDTISSATYANPKAMIGLKTGIFDEDAKIVFEVWYNKSNPDGSKRRLKLDLMQKFNNDYKESNGWMFAHFVEDSEKNDVRTTEENLKCFSCHEKRDNNVFAELKP